MSAQTGTRSLPPPPPSARATERVRAGLDRLKNEPNPIWIRELKQSVRRGHTPIVLMVLTGMLSLLMCTIGGVMTGSKPPSSVGVALFQTFFSLAYFVVTLMGPAIAANGIVSEREGRTWEAVLLTGMRPADIAHGKFLGAFTTICLYIVMLAPVGALCFLFGGVTATEVVVGFAFLVLIGWLSIAFGLAISSKMQRLGTAILLTMLLAMFLSTTGYGTLGPALSYAAHSLWPRVPEGTPVWLPIAYARAPFSLEYLVFLVVLPITAIALPGWFLYETTIANLTSVADDRSSGLKRWFLATSAVLITVAAIAPAVVPGAGRLAMTLTALAAFCLFLAFSAFVFAGEPIGPSRRVKIHWDRTRASAARRFLGPGIVRAALLLLGAGLGGIGVLTAVAMPLLWFGVSGTHRSPSTQVADLLACSQYAAAFFVFVVGFTAWIRSRTATPGVARVLLLVALFVASAGPFIVGAIGGELTSSGSNDWLVAAPSPFYVLKVLDALDGSDPGAAVAAGVVASIGWAVVGLGLLGLASRRCHKVIAEHDERLARADAMLAAEDAARAHPPEPPAVAPPGAPEGSLPEGAS